MVERLEDKRLETQVQQSVNSSIAGFCDRLSPNTRILYGGDLRDLFRFTGEDVTQLDQLTGVLIDKYFEHCKRRNLSRATIKRRTASISGLLRYAGMEELARETGNILTRHIGSTEEVQPLYPLTGEEVKKLQEVSQDNPRASAIIAIALGTGANATEILALHTYDIHETDGFIFVRFPGQHERMVELSPDASAIVKTHKEGRREDAPLFTKEQLGEREAKSLTRQRLFDILREYGERIGRPDLNPRVLRQTFIVNVQTNDPKELAELLGITRECAYRMLERRRFTQQLPQSEVLFDATAK